MGNGRMQCLFPAETAALREERCFLNYTGTGYKNAICPLVTLFLINSK